jgi:vesicular inhibitory amino acid transporter
MLLERTLLPIVSVCTSILVPGFSSTMAFLGSFAAFTICIIGPIAVQIALTGKRSLMDMWILVIIGVMAIWGTAAAFWEV